MLVLKEAPWVVVVEVEGAGEGEVWGEIEEVARRGMGWQKIAARGMREGKVKEVVKMPEVRGRIIQMMEGINK